jgi:hypothetical protein
MIRALVAAATVLLAATATAQTLPATTGVAADRLTPAIGPASFLGVEGAATTPPRAVSWAAGLGLLHDPITLRRAFADGVVARPVRDQLVTDVALEFGVWKRLAVAIGVPVVLYQDGDRLRGLGVDERPLQATAAGDVRVRIKGVLAGDSAKPGLHAALILTVTAPAGGGADFAATDSATVEPRLIADWRGARLALAATVGARFAKERTLFETTLGDELVWGAAGAITLVERSQASLSIVLEGAGAVGAAKGTRPVELRGAVRASFSAVAVDAGAGGGVDREIGAPDWRVFVIVRGALPLTR